MSPQLGSIILGLLLIISGLRDVITGEDGTYWGMPVPAWTGWVFLLIGIIICTISIRALWRNRNAPPKPPVNIDEAAARAEAELDAMYLREHGKLPEKLKKDV